MKNVHFLPWVGENYDSPRHLPLKIMVLGESHYTEDDAEDKNLTTKCVNHFQIGTHNTNRFFDMVSACLLGYSSVHKVTQEKRDTIWNDVLFYNFIQESVNEGPRGVRTKNQWEGGKEPFLQVISKYKPDLIIAFGYGVAQHLPSAPIVWSQDQDFRKYELSLKSVAYQCAVKHPAGGLKYSDFHRIFSIGKALVMEEEIVNE